VPPRRYALFCDGAYVALEPSCAEEPQTLISGTRLLAGRCVSAVGRGICLIAISHAYCYLCGMRRQFFCCHCCGSCHRFRGVSTESPAGLGARPGAGVWLYVWARRIDSAGDVSSYCLCPSGFCEAPGSPDCKVPSRGCCFRWQTTAANSVISALVRVILYLSFLLVLTFWLFGAWWGGFVVPRCVAFPAPAIPCLVVCGAFTSGE